MYNIYYIGCIKSPVTLKIMLLNLEKKSFFIPFWYHSYRWYLGLHWKNQASICLSFIVLKGSFLNRHLTESFTEQINWRKVSQSEKPFVHHRLNIFQQREESANSWSCHHCPEVLNMFSKLELDLQLKGSKSILKDDPRHV